MGKTAAQIAAKQVRRAQEAASDYTQGIENVTESPMAKAIKKKDKMRANVLAAIDGGKWQAGLESIDLPTWKAKTAKLGGERYAGGVEAAADKIAAFHEEFQPFVQRVKAEVDAMPDSTPDQRIARMVANAKGLAKFTRTRRRR